MNRPLVWVGIAYALGEGLAFAKCSWQTGLFLSVLFIAAVYAGERQNKARGCLILYLLPAFFIFGFIMLSKSLNPADGNLCEDSSRYVSFYGKVTNVQEKENSIALTISDASLEYELTEDEAGATGSGFEEEKQALSICGFEEEKQSLSIPGFEEEKQYLSVRSSKEDSQYASVTCGIVVYADQEAAAEIESGFLVSGKGTLEEPDSASNPGQFDMKQWFLAQGISYTLIPDTITIQKRAFSYRTLLSRLRKAISEVFSRLFNEQEAGILDAMILGDKLLLDEDIRELFRMMGISHILAISGLHVSLIGQGLYKILRRLGLGFRAASLASSFAVLSYGVLSGMSASTQRAVIMFLVSMGAEYLGRTYDMLCALALAELIIFIRQPLMISQSGVQFSFSALLALGVLSPAIEKAIPESLLKSESLLKAGKKNVKKDGYKYSLRVSFIKKLVPAISTLLLTLPLTAVYYGELPLLSLPMNLIILPSMSLLVPMAAVTGVIGLISLGAAAFAGGSVDAILKLCTGACRIANQIPFASLRTGVPPKIVIIFYYAAILLFILAVNSDQKKMEPYLEFLRKNHSFPFGLKGKNSPVSSYINGQKNRDSFTAQKKTASFTAKKEMSAFIEKKNVAAGLLLISAFLILLFPWRRLENFTAFMDVGQGDGIFMRSNGTTWMIDGGSTSVDEVGKYRIIPFMTYYGEKYIDYAMVTHGDEDHLSGVRELLLESRIKHLVLTKASKDNEKISALASIAVKHGAQLIYIEAGDSWCDGKWKFSCIYPAADVVSDDTNDLSLVLRLDVDSLHILFTGDIPAEVEQVLLNTYGTNSADSPLSGINVLKCPHHGSQYSSSDNFLHALMPQVTIISCGKNNSYGHPHTQTLERLAKIGTKIIRTDEKGAVIIKEEGGKIKVKTYR